MANYQGLSPDLISSGEPAASKLPLSSPRRRLFWFKRLVPPGLFLLVLLYQIGPARWIHDRLGSAYHFWAELILYGTVGPLLAYILIDLLDRWQDERETSDLQAKVLAQAQENIRTSLQINDDALQALFAVDVILKSIENDGSKSDSIASGQIQSARKVINQTIRQLHDHLLDHST